MLSNSALPNSRYDLHHWLGKDIGELKSRLAEVERLVRERPAPQVFTDLIVKGEIQKGGTHCEGTYDCFSDGTIFKIGTRSRIGFWEVETCPGSTTLGDGSQWRLIPGTCKCD
jgi:hypothetical protein